MPRRVLRRPTTKRPVFRKKRFNRRRRAQPRTTTKMMFKPSRSLHQPMPDRYFTWLEQVNQGYIATNTSSPFIYGLALNDPIAAFGKKGGAPSAFPNPLTSVANQWPTGLANLLTTQGVTGANSSGIYNQFRVWGVKVTLSHQPENVADTGTITIAPVVGSNDTYATAPAIMSSPNSMTKMLSEATNSRSNTVSKYYRIYELLGIPKKLYAAGYYGNAGIYTGLVTTSNSTAFLQVCYQNGVANNTSGNIPISVKFNWFIELFSRTDANLLTIV